MAASTTRGRLDAALDGVPFPADRDTLVEAARAAGDDDTARALRAIPPVEYGAASEVVASVKLTDDDHPAERDGSADDAGPPRGGTARG